MTSQQPVELPNQHNQTSWQLDIFLLVTFLGSLFFIFLGDRALFVPDEGRYAEIAREMAATGNYITPHLNGIKYFEKPALFYWMGAGAIQLFGKSLFTLRSINALLGLLGCLITYFTARQLYNRATGLLAAIILGSSTLYFVMAHMISLDLSVTVYLTISLYAFLLGTQQKHALKRRAYLWCAFMACALAVLTKGLIGLLFPILIVGCWILLLNQWRILKQLYLPSSLLLFVLVAAPWHIIVGWQNPEFFYFYFIEQHFLRYTMAGIGHEQPAWFFIPSLMLGFFPWIIFLPQTLFATGKMVYQARHRYQTELFLLLWPVLIFIFFSFSKSKLIPYILPIFPPLAILTARYLVLGKYLRLNILISLGILVLFSCLLAYIFYYFSQHTLLPDPRSAVLYLELAAMIILLGAILALSIAYFNQLKGIAMLIPTSWLFLVVLLQSFPAIDARTVKPLADIIKARLVPGDEVIAFNQYFQDLPFYLNQPITILNWKNELSFGMQHQNTAQWMINDGVFWQRFHEASLSSSTKHIFVILSKDSFQHLKHNHPQEHFTILGSTINNLLLSNDKIK